MEISTDPRPASPPATLDHHPAAALFPLLAVDGPEFGELVQDIREHGLIQPIVLHDGEILDGRNAIAPASTPASSCEHRRCTRGSPVAIALETRVPGMGTFQRPYTERGRVRRWTKVDPPVAPGGDVGGDIQATEAYSVRFRPVEEPDDGMHALVTDTWHGEATGDTRRDGPFRLTCRREYLICTDPKAPGSTEVWSDDTYGWLGGEYATTRAAASAAIARALSDNGADIRWDGRYMPTEPIVGEHPMSIEPVDDNSLDYASPDYGRDAALEL